MNKFELIAQILDFQKVDDDSTIPNISSIDPKSLANEVVDFIKPHTLYVCSCYLTGLDFVENENIDNDLYKQNTLNLIKSTILEQFLLLFKVVPDTNGLNDVMNLIFGKSNENEILIKQLNISKNTLADSSDFCTPTFDISKCNDSKSLESYLLTNIKELWFDNKVKLSQT